MNHEFSDYWQCVECGAVLYSPTTGRADGVPCWKCSNVPLIIGERKPTVWRPAAASVAIAETAAKLALCGCLVLTGGALDNTACALHRSSPPPAGEEPT